MVIEKKWFRPDLFQLPILWTSDNIFLRNRKINSFFKLLFTRNFFSCGSGDHLSIKPAMTKVSLISFLSRDVMKAETREKTGHKSPQKTIYIFSLKKKKKKEYPFVIFSVFAPMKITDKQNNVLQKCKGKIQQKSSFFVSSQSTSKLFYKQRTTKKYFLFFQF